VVVTVETAAAAMAAAVEADINSKIFGINANNLSSVL